MAYSAVALDTHAHYEGSPKKLLLEYIKVLQLSNSTQVRDFSWVDTFSTSPESCCPYLTKKHPDYAVLAARIAISNLHKETKKNFSQVIKDLYEFGELVSSVRHNLRPMSFASESKEQTSSKYDIARDI